MPTCPHCGKEFTDELIISESDAEAIFKLYPRKIAKPAALRAIRNALKTTKFPVLRRAVAQLALQWDNHDLMFLPYPATWFNEQRYLDDPETWAPKKPPALTVSQLIAKIKSQEEIVSTHRGNPNYIGYDARICTDKDRADYKEQKALLAKLRAQSAG